MQFFYKFWDWLASWFVTKKMNATAKDLSISIKRSGQQRANLPVQQVPPNDKKIHYILNDMSTPDLFLSINKPNPVAKPPFIVEGFKGGGFKETEVEFQASNAYVTVANTLSYMMLKTPTPLQNWVAKKPLIIIPRAGNKLNAYYDRRHLKFFSFEHPKIGVIHTADSSEIVAHELGHAILDSYRTDLWSAASLEVWAFHEAFADFTAMMNLMSHRYILTKIINETGGDIRKPNIASNLAEHLALSIFRIAGPNPYRSKDYLRSAINDFEYVNPGSLPEKAPSNQLAADSHSFGRVFTGALYDIMEMIYIRIRNNKRLGPIDSLAAARDTITGYMMLAIQNAPVNAKFFESVAKTLLWVDVKLSHRRFHDDMRDIFIKRKIIEPQLNILSLAPPCNNELGIMCTGSKMNLKLSHHFMRMQSANPLYDVEVEMPHQEAYLYDNSGNAIDHIGVSDYDALSGAQDTIIHLYETNGVGDGPDTPFEIRNGKLERTHFTGGFDVL